MIKPGFIKGEIINNEEEYDEGYDDWFKLKIQWKKNN
jgi:hypothetical protein